MRRGILLVLAVVAGACGDGPGPRAKDAEVDLVPAGGLERIEARLVARGRIWTDRRCPRPILRGRATPGSGAAALAALAAGPDLARCATAVQEPRRPGRDRLLETCAPVLDAARGVVRHAEVCSPWLPGVLGDPEGGGLLDVLGRAQVLLAGRDGRDTLWDALDMVRLQQDALRGGGSARWAPRAVHAFRLHQEPLIRRLLEGRTLGADALAQAADALGVLVGSEPSPGDLVEAWTYRLFVQEWQPRLHGIFWVPPGGWDPGHPYRWHWDEESAYIDQGSEKTILLLALERHLELLSRACPGDAGHGECVRGLYGMLSPDGDGEGGVRRLMRAFDAPDAAEVFLDWFTTISARDMGAQAWVMVADLELLAWRRMRLAQQRVHASVCLAARRTGRCPTPGELGAGILADPVFGGVFGVEAADPVTWTLRPGGRFTDDRANALGLDYTFDCTPG
jgi:hypothetical protein